MTILKDDNVCKDCVIDLTSRNDPIKLNKYGAIIAGALGGTAILITAISYPFVSPALRRICLPYVPATTSQVSNVFQILKGRSGRLIDLGSGDGRLVLKAAEEGFNAVGVELNPWLVLYSKLAAFRYRLNHKAQFIKKDIWKTDISPYNNVVVFGVESMMSSIEEKCTKELSKGSVVVACRFPLPTILPKESLGEGIDTVWLYEFKT